MEQPINRDFNVATMHIAGRLFPRGWDAREDAPATLEEATASFRADRVGGPRFAVYRGASERTAFADREVNWAFRAWHDHAHITYGLDFTPEGEAQAAAIQALHLVTLYGTSGEGVTMMLAQLFCEVVGQVEYERVRGEFPADQYAFTLQYLPAFIPAARAFLRRMEHHTANERLATYAALAFAVEGRIAPDARLMGRGECIGCQAA